MMLCLYCEKDEAYKYKEKQDSKRPCPAKVKINGIENHIIYLSITIT